MSQAPSPHGKQPIPARIAREIARGRMKLATALMPVGEKTYWEKREYAVYIRQIAALVHLIGRNAQSIIDVGSKGCPYLDEFTWIARRVSVDLRLPYSSPAVEGIKSDFLDYEPAEHFDVCLCLQTLEHVPDAARFARKLLATADHVLISVPYMWHVDACDEHVHDPVDKAKVEGWFGRPADMELVAREPNGFERLVCYYDTRA